MARLCVRATPSYGRRTSAVLTAAPITLAAWVRATTLPGAIMDVVTLTDDTVGQDAFELGLTAANVVGARAIGGGSNATGVTAGTVSAGTWAHVAAIFTSATSRNGVLNGVVGTTEVTSITPNAGNLTTTSVGAYGAGAFSLSFDGDVADVAIWNVALAAADLLVLAAGVSPILVRPDALVAYWPLIGQTSPEIELWRRLELTLTGTPVASAHPRLFSPWAPTAAIKPGVAVATGAGRMFAVF